MRIWSATPDRLAQAALSLYVEAMSIFGGRECESCRLFLSLAHFPPPLEGWGSPACTSCCRMQGRADSHELRREDILRLWREQEGACAVCRTELDREFPPDVHIDHCHRTERFRGILCRSCNQGLGFFADDPVRLARAIVYLASDSGVYRRLVTNAPTQRSEPREPTVRISQMRPVPTQPFAKPLTEEDVARAVEAILRAQHGDAWRDFYE